MTVTLSKLSGAEHPTSPDIECEATILDFWRWGFSDLLSNVVRGIFGEWLVAQLLGFEPPPRDSWAECDIITPEGVRIEVKTTAFLQTWNPTAVTKNPVFGGLKGQIWTPATGYSGTATFNADLYVFCVQIEQEIARWNALDFAQWRFFLLHRDVIVQRNTRSIALSVLRKLAHELTAAEFQRDARAMIHG